MTDIFEYELSFLRTNSFFYSISVIFYFVIQTYATYFNFNFIFV